MSENENQQSTIAANLCKNGCGFYGSTQFDGMCSVCHKENMKKRQKQDEEQIQKPNSSPHAASLLCASSNNVFESGGNNKRLSNSNEQPVEHSSEDDSHGLQQSAFSAGSDQIAAAADSAAGANTNEDCHAASGTAEDIGVPLKSAADVAAGTAAATGGVSAEIASICSSGASASASSSSTMDSSLSKKPNRCGMCKKKVGLTGFNCRCGGQFCSLHRYSDKHNCQFDYQSHGQAEIRKANPQVVSTKIEKL